MRNRRVLATGVAMALAFGATACGSDSDSDSASSGTSTAAAADAAPAANAPKGDPIVIGAVGSYTGAQAASIGAADETIKAWAAHTNATGGINGHPVKITVLDDAGNPTQAAQQVKKLVEEEKVQALVGSASLVTAGFSKYTSEKNVPVIGSTDFEQAYAVNPLFFPVSGQLAALDYGVLAEAKKAGVKKIGIMPCAETAVCTQAADLLTALAKIVGVEVVFNQKITVSQPTYTAACLAAKAKGVDGLAVFVNAETVLRVADQCAQQGYKPKQINVAATTGRIWEGQASMEGAITAQSSPVLADVSVPALKTFHQALDQYQPDVSKGEQYNEIDSSVWAGGETFKLAAERAKLTPTSTPADVLKGLHTFEGETVDGLTPPLTYVKGKPSFVGCYYPQEIKSGKFTPLTQGAKPNCIPEADVPKIAAALGG